MKVSKMILWLEEVQNRHGDLEVVYDNGDISEIIEHISEGEYEDHVRINRDSEWEINRIPVIVLN